MRFGTSFVRTHVDVDTDAGLSSIEGVRAAAERLADKVTVEIVAFPQSGLLVRPGTVELLDAAMSEGADLVGGIDPAGFDRDPVGHLNAVFGVAERHAARVDIHLHDRGELGAWELELIAERTKALGMEQRVTVSHAFALATVNERRQSELVDLLATSGISVATAVPITVPMIPLSALHTAGVQVGVGNDGIRDLWSPYGNGDLLERAMLMASRCGFTP